MSEKLETIHEMPYCEECGGKYQVEYPENYYGQPCASPDCEGTIEKIELVRKSEVVE